MPGDEFTPVFLPPPIRPPRSRRGGARPGAGAPRGNVNGIRSGAYSRRFYLAALMIAVVPELRLLFDALQRDADRKDRRRYLEVITEAYKATLLDPDLASSIKRLLRNRVLEALQQIQAAHPTDENTKTQSCNQTQP